MDLKTPNQTSVYDSDYLTFTHMHTIDITAVRRLSPVMMACESGVDAFTLQGLAI